jgi:hypothetical protein
MAVLSGSPVEAPEEPIIDPRRLAYALLVRGKFWADLARGPHGVSKNTVTKLRRGDPVRADALVKVGRWLHATPIHAELAEVIARPLDGAA